MNVNLQAFARFAPLSTIFRAPCLSLVGFMVLVLSVSGLSSARAQPSTAPVGRDAALTLTPPPFASAAGILVDGRSGKILWGKDDGVVRAPASLTKILTALIVLEEADLKARVTISPEARAAPGSRTYAEAGWTFSVQDLLYGLLLPSGNDAAIALAQKVSPDGTVAGFMTLVNRRAAEIGATATHLQNPHGLDEPGHVTSARDMALISMTAMRNPTFASIVATKRHTVPWGDGTRRLFQNHNKMLRRHPGTIGVKTGYTNQARHTLVSAVRQNGETLLAVTLGSPRQYDDSRALSDWGFAHLAALRAAAQEDIWPDRTPAPAPAGGAGSNLIGDVLGLLRSGTGPISGVTLLPQLAVGSLMGGGLALTLLSARIQRRVRRQPMYVTPRNGKAPAAADVPYVTR